MNKHSLSAFINLLFNKHFLLSLAMIIIGPILMHITSGSLDSSIDAAFFGIGLAILLAGTLSMSHFITKNAPSRDEGDNIRNEIPAEEPRIDFLASRRLLILLTTIGAAITIAGTSLIGSNSLFFLGFVILAVGLVIATFGAFSLFMRAWLLGWKR